MNMADINKALFEFKLFFIAKILNYFTDDFYNNLDQLHRSL